MKTLPLVVCFTVFLLSLYVTTGTHTGTQQDTTVHVFLTETLCILWSAVCNVNAGYMMCFLPMATNGLGKPFMVH